MARRKRNLFNSIPMVRPRRNTFDLTNDWKTDAKFGVLEPVFICDVVPGDRFTIQDELLVRFDALIAPILHNVNVYVHYFFVPNRLLWDDWEEFITGGPDGTSELVPPGIMPDSDLAVDYFQEHGLFDYLGVQPVSSPVQDCDPISLLPFKAYTKIFNDYYRDQNLTEEVDIRSDLGGVVDLSVEEEVDMLDDISKLRYRAWEKDYFTSALPWTQRGAQMSIPFNLDPVPVSGMATIRPFDIINDAFPDGSVPSFGIYGIENNPVFNSNGDLVAYAYGFGKGRSSIEDRGTISNVGVNTQYKNNYEDVDTYLSWMRRSNGNIEKNWVLTPTGDRDYPGDDPGVKDGLQTMPQGTTGAPTINDLRVAMRIQEWMETNAVGGSRYIEQIYAHFGVKSSDSRLQRAEYLGGGKVPVVISEVEQTSSTDTESPQGNLAGQAISVGKSIKFKKYFEEHGWILGIMSIMPRASYSQGVPRMFTRQTKFDFFWPKFAHLGEQPIYNQELFLDQTANGKGTFGYTPRYSEYKFYPSTVHGALRSSKSFWHLSRMFNEQPNLNEQFVYLNSDTSDALDRIFAVTGNWPLTVEIFHKIWAKRPMPRFGTPSL